MPFFDYACNKCGHKEIDKLVRRHDEEVKCSQCGEVMTKQACATAGWLLRGDGFHRMHGKELIRKMEKNYGLESTV